METLKYLGISYFWGLCLWEGRAGCGGVRDEFALGGILELAGLEHGAWDNLAGEDSLLVYYCVSCGLFIYFTAKVRAMSDVACSSPEADAGEAKAGASSTSIQAWGGNIGCSISLLQGIEMPL